MNDDMKDKSICVVESKPKTKILTFWLKKSDGFELDTNKEKRKEREPVFSAEDPPPDRTYMSIL